MVFEFFFVFLTSVAQAQDAQVKPACDLKTITQGCKLTRSVPLPPDPGLVGKAVRLVCPSCLKEWASSTPVDMKKIISIGEMTKKYIMDEILAGRPRESLGTAEGRLYDKVKVITFRPTDKVFHADCQAGPGAFFVPFISSITVCANLAHLSAPALLFVIGHEIGHAIDTCQSSLDLFEVDPKALDKIDSNKAPSVEVAQRSLENIKNSINTFGNRISAQTIGLNQRGLDFLDFLSEKGAIRRTERGIEPQDYPMNPVMTCLRLQTGFKDAADIFIRSNDSALDHVRDPQKAGNASVRLHRCFRTSESSTRVNQLNEAMGDVWGTLALIRYFQENPPKNDLQKFEPFSIFAYILCEKREIEPVSGQLGLSDHPPMLRRLEDIWLASKDIQKALGCESNRPDCVSLAKDILKNAGVKSSPSPPLAQ